MDGFESAGTPAPIANPFSDTPQVDTPPVVETPKGPDNEAVLSSFERIRLKEKQLRAKEAQLDEQRKKYSKFEELEKYSDEDPQKILDAYGVKYDRLVEKMINGTATPDEKSNLEKLQGDIANLNKKLEDKDKADEQKIFNEKQSRFVDSIKDHTKSHAQDYKLLEHFGMHDAVFDHLAAHFHKTGEQLSIPEASQLIESNLRSGLRAQQEKLSELQKLLDPPTEQTPESDAARVSNPSFSLSDNQFKSGTPTPESTRGLSDQQRFDLALSKL